MWALREISPRNPKKVKSGELRWPLSQRAHNWAVIFFLKSVIFMLNFQQELTKVSKYASILRKKGFKVAEIDENQYNQHIWCGVQEDCAYTHIYFVCFFFLFLACLGIVIRVLVI